MKYTIQNNGLGFCQITVSVPESLAFSFLAFIEQKSREIMPIVKTVSSAKNENYFIELSAKAVSLFDSAILAGSDFKTAISQTNYKLKAAGFANVSFDITRKILSQQGKLRRKSS